MVAPAVAVKHLPIIHPQPAIFPAAEQYATEALHKFVEVRACPLIYGARVQPINVLLWV
jgi:hypothetical protein